MRQSLRRTFSLTSSYDGGRVGGPLGAGRLPLTVEGGGTPNLIVLYVLRCPKKSQIDC
jgi:hypothetical protein